MSSNNTLKWAIRKRTLGELALGLVDRACDEAESQKEDWVDVCDALLFVASTFVEWGKTNPDDIFKVQGLLLGLIQLINRRSALRKGVSPSIATAKIIEDKSIVPLMEWLNTFLRAYGRTIVTQQNIPVGDRPFDPVPPPETYRVPQSLDKVTKNLARLKKKL